MKSKRGKFKKRLFLLRSTKFKQKINPFTESLRDFKVCLTGDDVAVVVANSDHNSGSFFPDFLPCLYSFDTIPDQRRWSCTPQPGLLVHWSHYPTTACLYSWNWTSGQQGLTTPHLWNLNLPNHLGWHEQPSQECHCSAVIQDWSVKAGMCHSWILNLLTFGQVRDEGIQVSSPVKSCSHLKGKTIITFDLMWEFIVPNLRIRISWSKWLEISQEFRWKSWNTRKNTFFIKWLYKGQICV